MSRETWLVSLDAGIAPYVDMLNAAGVQTFESCEGGAGQSFREPTVRLYGDRSEGFRALGEALQRNLPVRALRRYWRVSDREPTGPH